MIAGSNSVLRYRHFLASLADEISPIGEIRLISGFIALLIAMQFWLAYRLNIHWDEYFFLSHIHTFLQERPLAPFQTFHVHLLAWVAMLPISEADQIVAGRIAMLVCELVTLVFLYLTGRSFLSKRDAAYAVLAFCGAGFVLRHGASFRTDPLAAMFIMAALCALVRLPLRWFTSIIAGLATAIALLITIKSILYLPAFGAALLLRLSNEPIKRVLLFFALGGMSGCAFYAAGWLLHTELVTISSLSSGQYAEPVKGAFEKTVASQKFFPGLKYFLYWIGASPLAAIAIFGGFLAAARKLIGRRLLQGSIILLLMAPLASLLFYRNAYPYFYPFILFAPALGAGALSAMVDRPLYRLTSIVSIGCIPLIHFYSIQSQDQSTQRKISSVVHSIFPKPVPYIDRCGMIPTFSKTGFFMSSWGIEGILASGRPAIAPLITKVQPKMVIANHSILTQALDASIDPRNVTLHPDDVAALRANYIHYWGPIFLPGMVVRPDATKQAAFSLIIEGRYTLECKGQFILDGQHRQCGSSVILKAGKHYIGLNNPGELTLRWGDHLKAPDHPPPVKPIFNGF